MRRKRANNKVLDKKTQPPPKKRRRRLQNEESDLVSCTNVPEYEVDPLSLTEIDNCGTQQIDTRNNAILKAAILFLESSSDSDSDNDFEELITKAKSLSKLDDEIIKEISLKQEPQQPRCRPDPFEETLPSYTDQEFRQDFRISRELYERICNEFSASEMYASLRKDKRLSHKTYIASFLWFAGHEGCTYRDISNRFSLSLGAIYNVIHRVSMYISSMSPKYIKWPNEVQKMKTGKFFGKMCGFTKAIGVIDCARILIDPPREHKNDYYDGKGNTSICLQAVCDEHRKFTSIFVGYPGSSQESWVFQNSPLFNKLKTCCGDHYLLANDAYPCSKYMITPYKGSGQLKNAQKDFNMKLSRSRLIIEKTFNLLKQRFRQLSYCKLKGIQSICHFVRACCVLHNMADDNEMGFPNNAYTEMQDDYMENDIDRENAVRDALLQQIKQSPEH